MVSWKFNFMSLYFLFQSGEEYSSKMNRLVNKQHPFVIEDHLDSYLTKKPADCILYSEDGSQCKIHKELFGQTEFMRQVLKRQKDNVVP